MDMDGIFGDYNYSYHFMLNGRHAYIIPDHGTNKWTIEIPSENKEFDGITATELLYLMNDHYDKYGRFIGNVQPYACTDSRCVDNTLDNGALEEVYDTREKEIVRLHNLLGLVTRQHITVSYFESTYDSVDCTVCGFNDSYYEHIAVHDLINDEWEVRAKNNAACGVSEELIINGADARNYHKMMMGAKNATLRGIFLSSKYIAIRDKYLVI